MDERNWIALLPFWLLIVPPAVLLLGALMDGTMRRDRDRDRDYDRDRRPVV